MRGTLSLSRRYARPLDALPAAGRGARPRELGYIRAVKPRGQAVGTVASIWRYPVESMQGEEIEGAVISERGVLGASLRVCGAERDTAAPAHEGRRVTAVRRSRRRRTRRSRACRR